MKRTTKYVALDVHQATTVASVRITGGRVIARSILPTEACAPTEFFAGMRGTVHLAFEEGTQAQWLHDLLAPLIDRTSCAIDEESTGATWPTRWMPTGSRSVF